MGKMRCLLHCTVTEHIHLYMCVAHKLNEKWSGKKLKMTSHRSDRSAWLSNLFSLVNERTE